MKVIPPKRRFDFMKDVRKVESHCPSSVKFREILTFQQNQEIWFWAQTPILKCLSYSQAGQLLRGAQLWAQLGHAGALSYLPISQPKGPSALDLKGLKCAGMSSDDIKELVPMHGRTALQAKTAGFNGVLIHAGNGFLLSQFLSPLFNHRSDGYGNSIEARCRIDLEVIKEVRTVVGPSFPVGLRINSFDQLDGGLIEADALEVVRLLDKSSIDLIDISGRT